MLKLFIITALTLFFIFTLQAQDVSGILKPDHGDKIGTCYICGMDVFEKMLTRVDLITADSVAYACGLGCASALMNQQKYDQILVYDCNSIKMVDGFKSYFLFGSRLVPTKAMMAVLSFAVEDDAKRFQKLYGGTILQGKDAFDIAGKIRLERMGEKKKQQEKK